MYTDTIRFTGLASGIDTQSMVKKLMQAESMKLNKLKQQRQMKEWQQQAYQDISSALKSFQTAMLSSATSTTSIRNKNLYKTSVASPSSDAISAYVSDDKIAGDVSFTVQQLGWNESYIGDKVPPSTSDPSKPAYDGTTKLSDLGINLVTDAGGVEGIYVDGKVVAVNNGVNATVNDLASALKTQGINLKYNKTINAFTMEGAEGAAPIMGRFTGGSTDAKITAAFGTLGLTGAGAQHIDGQNAKVTYMGQTVEGKVNTVEIEGVSITLSNKVVADNNTTYEVAVKTDTKQPTELIKNFVTEYNKLVDVLHGYMDIKRPRSGSYSHYEPLTDDEKEEMSEKQIEQWEAKAKTGILYRDSALSGIASQLRSQVYSAVDIGRVANFKTGASATNTLSMHEIGITTSNESGYIGKLQIDEKKLQAALESDPDAVANMFAQGTLLGGTDNEGRAKRLADPTQGIGSKLFFALENALDMDDGTLGKKAGIKDNAQSILKNDMFEELKDMDDRIYDMNKRLIQKENNYYAMFSRMENAIAQANNQMSALMSMA